MGPPRCVPILAAVCLLVMAPAAMARADTIRLSDGRLIEGQIVRDDETAVVILVNNVPQFFPAEEITAIVYSRMRVAVKGSEASSMRADMPQVLMDVSLIQRIRERLLTYHGFMKRVGVIAEYLRWGDARRAGVAAQRAAQSVLPLEKGQFNPLSALADLIILLGWRAPALWLALACVKEPRAFTRITEFFVPAYILLMLFMTAVTATTVLWYQLALFPLAVLGVGLLFVWMFVLTPRRALVAFLLAVAVNAGLEALLVYQGWLSASQLAFRPPTV